MYDQLKGHSDKLLSKYQCGFGNGLNTQHCLLAMIEKLRKSLDSRGASAALLTDLSKAFDCVLHDILIAKLRANRIKKGSLNLLFSYLKERKQRVHLNNTYNKWINSLFDVREGSKDLYLAFCYLMYFYAMSFCFSITFLWRNM